MSPLVISKMDATGSQSKSYQTQTTPAYLGQRCFTFSQWFAIMNGHSRKFCPTRQKISHSDTYFLSALLESHAPNLTTEAQNFQLPSQNCGLQRSSVRPHFVQRREPSANMDNNQTESKSSKWLKCRPTHQVMTSSLKQLHETCSNQTVAPLYKRNAIYILSENNSLWTTSNPYKWTSCCGAFRLWSIHILTRH